MRVRGLEPPLSYEKTILSRSRLPFRHTRTVWRFTAFALRAQIATSHAENAGDAVEVAQALVKDASGENLHLFGDEEADGWVTCEGE